MNGLFRVRKRDSHVSFAVGIAGERGKLQRVIRGAQIPRRHLGNMLQSFFVRKDIFLAQALMAVGQRLFQRVDNIVVGKVFKFKHTATGNDSGRHRRIRIFRRRTDKDNRALFDSRQKRVALRFIKTVTFVQQKIRTLVVHFQIVTRRFHRLFHVRNPCIDGVELDKLPVRPQSDYVGKGSFPTAGRAPKNTATQPIGGNRAAQKRAFRNDMLLPDKLVQRIRAHPLCQRLRRFFIVVKIK